MNSEAAQMGLFRRDQGLDAVEQHNTSWVKQMRRQARKICMTRGNVTSDDLHKFADSQDLQPSHHNAYGAVFRGKGWKCIGRCRSTRPSAHGREIKLWAWQ